MTTRNPQWTANGQQHVLDQESQAIFFTQTLCSCSICQSYPSIFHWDSFPLPALESSRAEITCFVASRHANSALTTSKIFACSSSSSTAVQISVDCTRNIILGASAVHLVQRDLCKRSKMYVGLPWLSCHILTIFFLFCSLSQDKLQSSSSSLSPPSTLPLQPFENHDCRNIHTFLPLAWQLSLGRTTQPHLAWRDVALIWILHVILA